MDDDGHGQSSTGRGGRSILSGFSLSQRICAAMLCGMLAPYGFGQVQGTPPQQQAPDAPGTQQPAAAAPTIAQQAQQSQQAGPVAAQGPFQIRMPHSHNPVAPYLPSVVPPVNLVNSPRLQLLQRDGKLYLTLKDAIVLALENNLDIAWFRYNLPIAETDYARTKAGGLSNGVNTNVAQSTQGGFSSTGGSTTGNVASSGATSGGGAGGAGGLVQSTLGNGTLINTFDPQLFFQGFVDHTTTPVNNPVVYGIPSLQQNTIEGITEYAQSFPLGTSMSVTYTGERQTLNSPNSIINPTLYSNFELSINQPLLAGFGLGTNERYIRIARKNKVLTDLGFKLQVITTITQVEDIYWDLVNAYQDEQVKERSLRFANETLDADQKQLQLQNVPAMTVMKDESTVATSEGDLTTAKATLKLQELQIKNAITKTIDDPALEDMPVIPLDHMGIVDENESKSVNDLVAAAEKNRPDVASDEISMQIAQDSLKSIKNELLPSLSLYGNFYGTGEGGKPNPECLSGGLSPEECASTLPTGFPGTLQNTFNYSSPEYTVGFKLNITLRNRITKADQFRAALEYRQREITYAGQKKNIRFDVRNSQFALLQAQARVASAQKARDLAQKTFDISKQEQKLGAMSSVDVLAASSALAVAESAFYVAQNAYEKAKVDIDRATGTTLDRMDISIDDAKSGVVTH
jgi:outer membrane protein TolC